VQPFKQGWTRFGHRLAAYQTRDRFLATHPRYQFHLVQQRKLATNTLVVRMSALRFLCQNTKTSVLAGGLTVPKTCLLFGVSASDPLMFATVPVLLAIISLAACFILARRATRVFPVQALRS